MLWEGARREGNEREVKQVRSAEEWGEVEVRFVQIEQEEESQGLCPLLQ